MTRPVSPVNAARSGRTTGKRNELRIVAVEPRQQTRAQKRRLARAGRAEDRHQSWRRSRSKSAQPVDGVDDRRVAAKENAGVVGLLRFQAAIGGAIRFPLRRPGEKPRVEPCLLQPALQPHEPRLGIADMPLLIGAWRLGGKQTKVLAVNEIDDLPDAGQFLRERSDRPGWIGQRREQLLVEPARERIFLCAPARAEPVRRHEEDDRFAAARGVVQRPLPPLPRRNSPLRIEIKENVLPAFGGEPVAQRDRLEIVVARMAQKYPRHSIDPQSDLDLSQRQWISPIMKAV